MFVCTEGQKGPGILQFLCLESLHILSKLYFRQALCLPIAVFQIQFSDIVNARATVTGTARLQRKVSCLVCEAFCFEPREPVSSFGVCYNHGFVEVSNVNQI